MLSSESSVKIDTQIQAQTISRLHLLLAGGCWLGLLVLPYFVAGDEPLRNILQRAALIGAVILVTYLLEKKMRLAWALGSACLCLGGGMILYSQFDIEAAAWLMTISWFSLILLMGRWLFQNILAGTWSRWIWAVVAWGMLSGVAGIGLALYQTVSINFAEEEFFTLLAAGFISFWVFMLGINYFLAFGVASSPANPNRRFKLQVLIGLAACILLIIPSSLWLARQYQRSFFPLDTPGYAGISAQAPVVCETVNRQESAIPAETIKDLLITHMTNDPSPNTPTLGTLTLYTGDRARANAFRKSLLAEAEQELYTSPANSVKAGQFLAALRANHFHLISQAFPDLFSQAERDQLKAWFAQINRRALTVEWIDWLYALAYGKWPEGPYENQEIGAGLLAVLSNTDLAASDLAAQNRRYLTTTPLGLRDLFRNTDDAYVYQGVWLTNAWWLHTYRQAIGLDEETADQNLALAFQWLIALALPEGETLANNDLGAPGMAEYYLSGAVLLQQPELAWLAGKALLKSVEQDLFLMPSGMIPFSPQLPDGLPPKLGSCLVFGNSGVPTHKGTLGPDKVVLRDGWADDSIYALLNLRFSGWHRYKATNSMTLLYQAGPVVSEKWSVEPIWWLPKGRAGFRDKRVPRENLNGLLLPKTGLSQIVWLLSGIGSRWMQNPPAYAEVEQFFTTGLIDGAKTILQDWEGWQHTRTTYLLPADMVLVVDEAKTERGSGPASLVWHVNGSGIRQKNSLRLDTARRQASMVWSDHATDNMILKPLPPGELSLHSPDWELLYTSPDPKKLHLATAFRTKESITGEMTLTFFDDTQGLYAVWRNDQQRLSLLHNSSGRYQAHANLGTDGNMVALWEDAEQDRRYLCYQGGQTISLSFAQVPGQQIPTKIGNEETASLSPDLTWQVEDESLVINFAAPATSGCLQLQ